MLCYIRDCEFDLLSFGIRLNVKRSVYSQYDVYLYDVWFWHGNTFGMQYLVFYDSKEEEGFLPPKELIKQYQKKRANLNADMNRILT